MTKARDIADSELGSLTVDTDTLVVDETNKRVGIGTSGPQAQLHLAQNNPKILLEDTLGGSSNNFSISADIGLLTVTQETDDVPCLELGSSKQIFYTGNSEAMRINSSGKVGIGTSSPSKNLDVVGKVRVKSGATLTDPDNSNTHLSVQDGSDACFVSVRSDDVSSAGLLFGDSTDDFAGGFVYNNADDSLRISASNSEAMRIDSSGNVGIGTSSPSATLDVNGSLSKNSGSFKINHPVKPDTHHLVHSFVEGPQADNLYRGKSVLVDGKATVNLDEAGRMTEGTFVALNGNVQCWTTNEDGWTQVRGKVDGNILTIEAQDPACTNEVSWLVIGERHDQHMIETEWTDENGRVITEPAKENAQ